MDMSQQTKHMPFTCDETQPTILSAEKSTGELPMELFITDEHKKNYLSLQTGAETNHGLITGILSLGTLFFSVMAVWMAIDSEWEGVKLMLTLAPLMFILPFLWETRQKLPLPIIFNRRTREVYVEHHGKLYHTPWDGIQAVAYEFNMIGLYTGSTHHASMEIRVHHLGEPGQSLMLSVGTPFGKTLKMQKGFWEYIRAYMNNGPWFDKEGHHSESDDFVKSQLDANLKASDILSQHIRKMIKKRTDAGGRNYLSGLDVLSLLVHIAYYPAHRIQDLTYNIAKRRSRNRWPEIVLERLRPDGPTTRLIDLERERGLEV